MVCTLQNDDVSDAPILDSHDMLKYREFINLLPQINSRRNGRPCEKLVKLRRCVSRVHIKKYSLEWYILEKYSLENTVWKIQFGKYSLGKYTL